MEMKKYVQPHYDIELEEDDVSEDWFVPRYYKASDVDEYIKYLEAECEALKSTVKAIRSERDDWQKRAMILGSLVKPITLEEAEKALAEVPDSECIPLTTAEVERIMKYATGPEGWTDLKPLGMDKFRQWLHSHGKY